MLINPSWKLNVTAKSQNPLKLTRQKQTEPIWIIQYWVLVINGDKLPWFGLLSAKSKNLHEYYQNLS